MSIAERYLRAGRGAGMGRGGPQTLGLEALVPMHLMEGT